MMMVDRGSINLRNESSRIVPASLAPSLFFFFFLLFPLVLTFIAFSFYILRLSTSFVSAVVMRLYQVAGEMIFEVPGSNQANSFLSFLVFFLLLTS